MAQKKWYTKTCALQYIMSARKNNDQIALSIYYQKWVGYYLNLGKFDSIDNYLDSVKFIEKPTIDPVSQAFIYNSLGQKYFYTSYTDSCLYYFNKAKDIYLAIGDSSEYYGMLNNLSVVYAEKTEHEKELELLVKVAKHRSLNNDIEGLAYTYINLAQCYESLIDTVHSFKYAEKAKNYAKKTGDNYLKCYAYMAKGDALNASNKVHRALTAYYKSKKIAQHNSHNIVLAAVYKGLADAHSQLLNLDSSAFYYQKSISFWTDLGDVFQTTHTKIYYAQALAKNGNQNKSIELLLDLIPVVDSNNYIFLKLELYKLLAETYKETKQFEKSIDAFLTYEEVKDTLKTRLLSENLSKIRLKFKDHELEQENAILKVRAEKSSLLLALLVSTSLAIILIILIIYINKRREQLKIIETQNRIFSVIAHDLRGPMGSLAQLLNIMDDVKDNESALKLAKQTANSSFQLLDNLLIWANGNAVSTKEIKERIDLSAKINEIVQVLKLLAETKQIDISISGEQNLHIQGYANQFEAILRNIINNSIKFCNTHGQIKIFINKNDKWAIIKIEDNGIGMDTKQLENLRKGHKIYSVLGTNKEKGTGMGIRIVQDFVALHRGKLTIESAPNMGTSVIVFLPLK